MGTLNNVYLMYATVQKPKCTILGLGMDSMLKSDMRILLADDHPLMLDGLAGGLRRMGYQQILTTSTGRQVLNILTDRTFDILILDIEMPEFTGFQIVEKMRNEAVHIPVVFLSYHKEKQYLLLAKKLGVQGYLLKEDGIDVLHRCIQHVMKGQEFYSPSIDTAVLRTLTSDLEYLSELTKSERVILKHIARGLSSGEVAKKLHISKRTVQNHRANIFQKLSAEISDSDLGTWAVQNKRLIDML